MSLQLRPYQDEMIVGARQHFRSGRKRVLLQLTCRGGKTAIAGRMLNNAIERGRRTQFNVHRRELVLQVRRALDKEGIRYGLMTSKDRVNLDAPVQICSIPTLARRYKRLPKPDLVVWDECHHIGARSWDELFRHYQDAYHIGLSATPERADIGLGEYFEAMVCGPSPAWMMEQGYISKYECYRPDNGFDPGSLRTRMGEFVASDSAELISKRAIVGNAIDHYKKHCDGAKAVAFCVSVKASQQTAQEFRDRGIPAMHVDGDTSDELRDLALQELLLGKLRVITNVDLFGEGVDLPGLEAGIYLRPTMSRPLHIQQMFRPLTAFEGKPYSFLLDCVGNTFLHGLPDAENSWELTTGRVEKKPKAPPPRVCGYCFGASPAWSKKCRICQEPYPVESREVDQVSGDLAKVEPTAEQVQQRQTRREQGMARDMEALIQLGRQRGMKKPEKWAQHVMDARRKKEQAA